MKNSTLILYSIISLLAVKCSSLAKSDSVNITNKRNENRPSVDKDVSGFLVKIADARMMGRKEGELAVKKGTTKEIVDYGKLMIKDQAFLLSKLKKLATERHIILPAEISNDKKDGFADLNEKTGKDFDNKFIKMMRIDHERDIKDFKKANDFKDRDVTEFATRYLPMLQSHLDKLNEIKD